MPMQNSHLILMRLCHGHILQLPTYHTNLVMEPDEPSCHLQNNQIENFSVYTASLHACVTEQIGHCPVYTAPLHACVRTGGRRCDTAQFILHHCAHVCTEEAGHCPVYTASLHACVHILDRRQDTAQFILHHCMHVCTQQTGHCPVYTASLHACVHTGGRTLPSLYCIIACMCAHIRQDTAQFILHHCIYVCTQKTGHCPVNTVSLVTCVHTGDS